jgi:NADPH2:quinone reductase
VDRVIEVALGANLRLDLAVSQAGTVVVTYAAESSDPVLPVRACMSANVILRFVLLYGLPPAALDAAATGISAALAAGRLTELPVHRFDLADVVSAHETAERGVTGKVIVTPLPGGPATSSGRSRCVWCRRRTPACPTGRDARCLRTGGSAGRSQ